MRVLGWVFLSGGGLLVLSAVAAAALAVLVTGGIWVGGGRFTEGLGSLTIGAVVVVVVLLLGVFAVGAGFLLLVMTAK